MHDDDAFIAERPRLLGLAYRMLGEVGAAEDILQEAWVRWQGAEGVRNPAAWLTTVVTRLCLDEVGSARARRETYVGPWLPEPVPTPAERVPGELAESLTMAFIVLLQRLTPPQRAAFLLREVFEFDHRYVADVLDTTPDNARQLAARARKFVAAERPRFDPPGPEIDRLTARFGVACLTGDLDGLVALLAEDATVWSDGGGKVLASLRPISGAVRAARFLIGVTRMDPGRLPQPGWFNGQPGALLLRDGQPESVVLLDIVGGRIAGVRIVRNPDKLAHLTGEGAAPAVD